MQGIYRKSISNKIIPLRFWIMAGTALVMLFFLLNCKISLISGFFCKPVLNSLKCQCPLPFHLFLRKKNEHHSRTT